MPSSKKYGHIRHNSQSCSQAKVWAILASAAVWALAVCAWGASRIAALFGYHERLGPPLFAALGRFWYWPWKFLSWAEEYSRFPQVKQVVDQTYMAGVGVPMLALLIYLAFRQGLKGRDDLHSSAHWATPEEVEKTGLTAGQGVYVGAGAILKRKSCTISGITAPNISCASPRPDRAKAWGLFCPRFWAGRIRP